MDVCFTASPARTNGGSAMCGQMRKQVSPANHVSLRGQSRDGKNRQGSGCVAAPSQGPRERPLSTVCTSNVTPHSHQRRWSADFCECGVSIGITVRKNKKEPQPPQRGESLSPQPNTAFHPSSKRYSCPPLGVCSRLSTSSSASSTSSCSSPPPVQTSVITGHDPLGWKLRPPSSSTSPRARTNRLSLQIPLPVIAPQPKSSSAPPSQSDGAPNPDPSPRTRPPLRPKPARRHSDSSAFVRSLANPLPAVMLEELRGVQLRPVALADESDDVFGEEEEEAMAMATTRPRKIPPPVPEKTAMARQVAQLIGLSCRRCTGNEENIYASVIKPKPKRSHQTEADSSLQERKSGLRVDASCDRERSTPRFPGGGDVRHR